MARLFLVKVATLCFVSMAFEVTANEAGQGAPQASTTLVRGLTQQSVEHLSTALKRTDLSKEDKASILINRGVAYWRLGKPNLAIQDFNTAITLFPENAAIYNNRGNVLLDLGFPTEALKDYNRAIL